MQIVAVNNQVAVKRDWADTLVFVRHKRTEGHSQMMVVDKFLALEIQFGHSQPFIVLLVISHDFFLGRPCGFSSFLA